MPVGAGISAIGGIANAFIGSSAASKASKQQMAMQQQALAMQQKMFGEAQSALSPYNKVGQGAMLSLGALYGIGADGSQDMSKAYGPEAMAAFERSPDYAYARDSAMRTLDFSNSAKGMLGSREHLNTALQVGQGLATQNFGNYQTNLRNLGLMGLDAGKSIAGAATGFANMGTQSYTTMGNAQAAGTMGQANALTGGINTATNALTQYNQWNRNNSAYSQPNPWQAGGMGDPATYGNLPVPTANIAWNAGWGA